MSDRGELEFEDVVVPELVELRELRRIAGRLPRQELERLRGELETVECGAWAAGVTGRLFRQEGDPKQKGGV